MKTLIKYNYEAVGALAFIIVTLLHICGVL